MSNKEARIERLRELRGSLPKFAAQCLMVKTKGSEIIPLHLNAAQLYVHRRLQEQLRETGKVRALILKGRQQGISTYVAARFYHKSSLRKAVNVYILAHEQKATDNLFDIVDRFHRYNTLAPSVGASNAKELEFKKLESSYTVATAGQKAGGRSRTSTLFHGSEAGFWANAAEHFSASVQTVPDMDGTEVILESTANGPSGEFYNRWYEAQAGKGDYIAIFVPWFWQEEYARACDDDFTLSSESTPEQMSEVEYAEAFSLSMPQMAWRRAKMQELRSESVFDQEYPATAQMAFINSAVKSYIPALAVLRARKAEAVAAGPLIMGVDPAGPGGDRFSICGRRGHAVEFLEWRNKLEHAEAYHWCKEVILEHKPARFNVDAGGIGAAVISLLRNDDTLPVGVVHGVNFGSKAQGKMARPDVPGPKNRRAEMWTRMKDWLEGEEPVSVPDLDVLQADITAPQLKPTLTNDILLESKEEMRSRGVRSPDLGDSLALTFASLSYIKNYVDKTKPKPEYGAPDKRPNADFGVEIRSNDGWMV